MVMVSVWVSGQLGVNLAISSPSVDTLKSAKVSQVSVAAPLIRPTDEKAPDEEFVFDPIQVALGNNAQPVAIVDTANEDKGNEFMPGIPDSAQYLTEEVYLKNLLEMEDIPFESIRQPKPIRTRKPATPVKESIGNFPKAIEPLQRIELIDEDNLAITPADQFPPLEIPEKSPKNKGRTNTPKKKPAKNQPDTAVINPGKSPESINTGNQ